MKSMRNSVLQFLWVMINSSYGQISQRYRDIQSAIVSVFLGQCPPFSLKNFLIFVDF